MRSMPGLHTTDGVGSSTRRRFTTGHPAHLRLPLPAMTRLYATHSTIRPYTSNCFATTAKHWTFSVNLERDFLNGKGSFLKLPILNGQWQPLSLDIMMRRLKYLCPSPGSMSAWNVLPRHLPF